MEYETDMAGYTDVVWFRVCLVGIKKLILNEITHAHISHI